MKAIRTLLFFSLLLYSNSLSFCQSSNSSEYQLKAVFLYNFTQFIEWPASTFAEANAPFIIGVLGKNPFGNYLNETINGESVNGHPLIVEYYNTIEEVKACHVLFINISETEKMAKMLTQLKGKTVLTVSDAGNFLKKGGMINLFTKNNKIQFGINPEAAKNANLTVSSKLLRQAKIYETDKK